MTRPRWADLAGWAWLVTVAAFLTFFLLPRKGVDFGDEGWLLTVALGVVRGWHWDEVLPQAPTWALNALFMAAGVESYLALRFAFYALISVCLACAVFALEPARRLSGLQAALVTLAGLTTLNSLIAYNTTPHYLILASVSLLLLTAHVQRRAARASLVGLAAVAASAGGFLNFTMYPAAFASLAFLWLVNGIRRQVATAILLTAALTAFAVGWYFYEIGLTQFLQYPGAHGIHPSRALSGLRVVLEWAGPAAVIRLAIGVAWRGQPPDVRQRWQARTAALVVLFVSILFLALSLSLLGICSCGGPVVSRLFNAAGVIGLHGAARLHLPGMVIAVWGIAVLAVSLLFCWRDDAGSRRALALTVSLYLSYLFQELFSLMDPLYLFVYYAGPCLAIGYFLLLHRAEPIVWRCSGTALVLTFVGATAYSVYFTQPGIVSVLGPKEAVPIAKLAGLQESPERVETLTRLVTAFEEYDCRGRTVLTFSTTPLLYYLFEAEPPPGLEYIFMPYFFDPDRTLRALERSASWCVFMSWNVLARPSADQIRAQADTIIDYLERHSEHRVRLSAREVPIHAYDDFVLYAGRGLSARQ